VSKCRVCRRPAIVEVDGVYIGLGIGSYSDESGELASAFASDRGPRVRHIDLRHDHDHEAVLRPAKARRARG
jgi:hypothetical protein